MTSSRIEKEFYKEKRFIVIAGGKILFNGKEYKDVEQYFNSPDTCVIHRNDIVPNIHIDCWAQIPKIEYKHVKVLSDQPKYFIAQPAIVERFQFGHIWQDYYYRLFTILFHIKDKSVENPKLFLLGSDIGDTFTPQNSYYKSFTEKLVSDFGIEDYVFDDTPTIYEVDNFWGTNEDYIYDIKRINEYLFDESITPWRKVYASKSKMYGKWETPPYLEKTTNYPVKLSNIDKRLFVDKEYANMYEALIEQNVLAKKIYNENELEEFLESYGFESIEPGFHFHKEECVKYTSQYDQAFRKLQCGGGCSIEENIRYFNEVKTLVSTSASSLQNMIFMNPNKSNIVELETKFYQINSIDTNRVFMGIGEQMYDATGDIDPEAFSEACNKALRVYGEYHQWHYDLARNLGIGYSRIKNIDLDSRSIISKIKSNKEILEILSQ